MSAATTPAQNSLDVTKAYEAFTSIFGAMQGLAEGLGIGDTDPTKITAQQHALYAVTLEQAGHAYEAYSQMLEQQARQQGIDPQAIQEGLRPRSQRDVAAAEVLKRIGDLHGNFQDIVTLVSSGNADKQDVLQRIRDLTTRFQITLSAPELGSPEFSDLHQQAQKAVAMITDLQKKLIDGTVVGAQRKGLNEPLPLDPQFQALLQSVTSHNPAERFQQMLNIAQQMGQIAPGSVPDTIVDRSGTTIREHFTMTQIVLQSFKEQLDDALFNIQTFQQQTQDPQELSQLQQIEQRIKQACDERDRLETQIRNPGKDDDPYELNEQLKGTLRGIENLQTRWQQVQIDAGQTLKAIGSITPAAEQARQLRDQLATATQQLNDHLSHNDRLRASIGRQLQISLMSGKPVDMDAIDRAVAEAYQLPAGASAMDRQKAMQDATEFALRTQIAYGTPLLLPEEAAWGDRYLAGQEANAIFYQQTMSPRQRAQIYGDASTGAITELASPDMLATHLDHVLHMLNEQMAKAQAGSSYYTNLERQRDMVEAELERRQRPSGLSQSIQELQARFDARKELTVPQLTDLAMSQPMNQLWSNPPEGVPQVVYMLQVIDALNRTLENQGMEFDRGRALDVGLGMGITQGNAQGLGRIDDAIRALEGTPYHQQAQELASKYAEANLASMVRSFKKMLVDRYATTIASLAIAGGEPPLQEARRLGMQPIAAIADTLQGTEVMDYNDQVRRNLLQVVLDSFDTAQSRMMVDGRGTNAAGARALQAKLANDALEELNKQLQAMGLPGITVNQQGRITAFYQQYATLAYHQHHVDPLAYMLLGTLGDSGEDEAGNITPLGMTTQTINPQQRQLRRIESQAEGTRNLIMNPSKAVEAYTDRFGELHVRVSGTAPYTDDSQKAAYRDDDVRTFDDPDNPLYRMSEQEVAQVFHSVHEPGRYVNELPANAFDNPGTVMKTRYEPSGATTIVDNERVTRGYDTVRDSTLDARLRQLQTIESAFLVLSDHPQYLVNMPAETKRLVMETVYNVMGDVRQGRSALQKRPGDMSDMVDNLLPPWARRLQQHIGVQANSTESMLDQLEKHLTGRAQGESNWPVVADLDSQYVGQMAQAVQRLNLNLANRNNQMGVAPKRGTQLALTMAQLALYAGPEILQHGGRADVLTVIDYMGGNLRKKLPNEQEMERFGEDLAGYLFNPDTRMTAVRENKFAGYNDVSYVEQEMIKYRTPLESFLRRIEERHATGALPQKGTEVFAVGEGQYSAQYFRSFDQMLDDAAIGYAGVTHIGGGAGNEYGAKAKVVEQQRERSLNTFHQLLRNLDQAMSPEQMTQLMNHLAEMGRKATREGTFSIPDVAQALTMMGAADVVESRMGHYVNPANWQQMDATQKQQAILEMVLPTRAGAQPSTLVFPGVENVGLNQVYPFAHMTAKLLQNGLIAGTSPLGAGFMRGLRAIKAQIESDPQGRGADLFAQLPEPVQMLLQMNDGVGFITAKQRRVADARVQQIQQLLRNPGLTATTRQQLEGELARVVAVATDDRFIPANLTKLRKFSEFNYAPVFNQPDGVYKDRWIMGSQVNPLQNGIAELRVRPENKAQFQQFLADVRALTVDPDASPEIASAITGGTSAMPQLGLSREQAEIAAMILQFGGLKEEEKALFFDQIRAQQDFGKIRHNDDLPMHLNAYETWEDGGNMKLTDSQLEDRFREMREGLQEPSYINYRGERVEGAGLALENLPIYQGFVQIPQEEREKLRALPSPRSLPVAAAEGETSPNFSEGMDATQLPRSTYGIMTFGELTRAQKLQVSKIVTMLENQGYNTRSVEGDTLTLGSKLPGRLPETVAPGWRNMLTGPEGDSLIDFLVVQAGKSGLPQSYQQAAQLAKSQGIPIHNLGNPDVAKRWQALLSGETDYDPGAKGFRRLGHEMGTTLTDYEYQMRLLQCTAGEEAPDSHMSIASRKQGASARMQPRAPPSGQVEQIATDTLAANALSVEQCAWCGRILNGPYRGEQLDEIGNSEGILSWSHGSCAECNDHGHSIIAAEEEGRELGESDKAFIRRRQMLMDGINHPDAQRERDKYPWLTGGSSFTGGENHVGFLKTLAKFFFGNGLLATTLPVRQPLSPYDFFRYSSKLHPAIDGQPLGGEPLAHLREASHLQALITRARKHGRTLSETQESAFYKRLSWGDRHGLTEISGLKAQLEQAGLAGVADLDRDEIEQIGYLAAKYDQLLKKGTGSEGAIERLTRERGGLQQLLDKARVPVRRLSDYRKGNYAEIGEAAETGLQRDRKFSPGWMKILKSLAPFAVILASMFGPSGVHDYDDSGVKPWQHETRRGDRPMYIDDLHDMANMPKDEWFEMLDMMGIRNQTVQTVEAMGYDIEELLHSGFDDAISSPGKTSVPRAALAVDELFPEASAHITEMLQNNEHGEYFARYDPETLRLFNTVARPAEDAYPYHGLLGETPAAPPADLLARQRPLARLLFAAKLLSQRSGQLLLPELAASLPHADTMMASLDEWLKGGVKSELTQDPRKAQRAPLPMPEGPLPPIAGEVNLPTLDEILAGAAVTPVDNIAHELKLQGHRITKAQLDIISAYQHLQRGDLSPAGRDLTLNTLQRRLTDLDDFLAGRNNPALLDHPGLRQFQKLDPLVETARALFDDPLMRSQLAFRDATRFLGGDPSGYAATQGAGFDLSRHIRAAKRNSQQGDSGWDNFWQDFWTAKPTQRSAATYAGPIDTSLDDLDPEDLLFAQSLGSGVHDLTGEAAWSPIYGPGGNFAHIIDFPINGPPLTGVERAYQHLSGLRRIANYNGMGEEATGVIEQMDAIEKHMGWPAYDDSKDPLSSREQYRRKKLRQAKLDKGVAIYTPMPAVPPSGYVPLIGKLGEHPIVEQQIRDLLKDAEYESENQHLYAHAWAMANSIGLHIVNGQLSELPPLIAATTLRQASIPRTVTTPLPVATSDVEERLRAAESGINAMHSGLVAMAAATPESGNEAQTLFHHMATNGEDDALIEAITRAYGAGGAGMQAQIKSALDQYRQGNTQAITGSVNFNDPAWSAAFTKIARQRQAINPATSGVHYARPGENATRFNTLFQRLPSLYTNALAGENPAHITALLDLLKQGAPLTAIHQSALAQKIPENLRTDFLQRVADVSGIQHPEIPALNGAGMPFAEIPPPAESSGPGAQQLLPSISGADIGYQSQFSFGLDKLRGFVGTDPYAARAMDSVLGPNPARLTAIEAPAGTGKTRLSAALLAGILAKDPTAKILVAAPTINSQGALNQQLLDLGNQLGDERFKGVLQSQIDNVNYAQLPRRLFGSNQSPLAGEFWKKLGFDQGIPGIINEEEMPNFMRNDVMKRITGIEPSQWGKQFGTVGDKDSLEDIYKTIQQMINDPAEGQQALLRGETEYNKNAAIVNDQGRTNLLGNSLKANPELWLGAMHQIMKEQGRVSFAFDQFSAARGLTSEDPEMQGIVQDIVKNAGYSHSLIDEAQQGSSSNHALLGGLMEHIKNNVVVGDRNQQRGEGMTGHSPMSSLRQYWGNLLKLPQEGIASFQRVFQRRLGWEQFVNVMGNPQMPDENGATLQQYHPGMKPMSMSESGDFPREMTALHPYEMAEKMIRMALEKSGYSMELAQKITREGSLTGDGIVGASKQVGMTMMNREGVKLLQRVAEDMGVEGVFGHEGLSGKIGDEYTGALDRNSRKIQFGTALSAGGWEAKHIIAGATNARFEKPKTQEEKDMSEQVNNLIALTRSKAGGSLSIFDTMTSLPWNIGKHLGLGHDPDRSYGYALEGDQISLLKRDADGNTTRELLTGDRHPNGMKFTPMNQPGTLSERSRVRLIGQAANYGIGNLINTMGLSTKTDLVPDLATVFGEKMPHDAVAALRDLTPEQRDDILAKATGMVQEQASGMLMNPIPGHRQEMAGALANYGIDAQNLGQFSDDDLSKMIDGGLPSARKAMRQMMLAGREYKPEKPQGFLSQVAQQYKQATGKEIPQEHLAVMGAMTEPALQQALDSAARSQQYLPKAGEFAGNLDKFMKTFEWMSSMVATVINPQFAQSFQTAVGITPGAGGVNTGSARADQAKQGVRDRMNAGDTSGSGGNRPPPFSGFPGMMGDDGETPKDGGTITQNAATSGQSDQTSQPAAKPSLAQSALAIGRTLGRTAFDMSFAGSAMLQEVQQQITDNQQFYTAANIANQYGGRFGGSYASVTANPLIKTLQTSMPGYSLTQDMQAYGAYSGFLGGAPSASNLTTAAGIAKATGTPIEQLLATAAGASAGGLGNPAQSFAQSTQSLLQGAYGFAGPLGTTQALDTISQMGYGSSDQKLSFLTAGSQAFGGSPATFANLGQLYNGLSQATYAPSMAQQTALAFLYKPQALTQPNGALDALSNLSSRFPGSGSPDYYSAQASLASNGLQAQQVGAQIKFNVANLQVVAQNAQIQMDALQYQSQQLQYSNAVAQQGISIQQYQQAQSDFAFQKQQDTAYYGPIGADTSRNAYYEFMKSQTQAARNPIAAGQTALNMNNYQTFGLNNLEFYAGIENQRSMATYGRSPLLADLGYKQTLKYLDQQEAFYQTSLQLQNQQRAYTYAKDQRELDWQGQTLALNQKSLDMQALLLAQGGKVLDANTAVQKASVSILELQTNWSKEELGVLGLSSKAALQSLSPNTGYNLTPWQIIQQGASAYESVKNDPNALKLFQGQLNNLAGGTGQGQTMMALVQYLAQNPSLMGDTQAQFIKAVGASNKFNVNDVNSLLTGGAAAGDIFAAGTTNAAIQTWSDPNQLNSLVNTLVGVDKAFATMATHLATLNVFLAAAASIASKVAPIGIASAGLFSGEALFGKGMGGAIVNGIKGLFGLGGGAAAADGAEGLALAGGAGLGAVALPVAAGVAGAAFNTAAVIGANNVFKQQGLDPLKSLGDDLGKAGTAISYWFGELIRGKINFGDFVEGLVKALAANGLRLAAQIMDGLKKVNWVLFAADASKDLMSIAKGLIGWFIPTDWKNTLKSWATDAGNWIGDHVPHLDLGKWLGEVGANFGKIDAFFGQVGTRATAILGIFDITKWFHIDWTWIGNTFGAIGATIVSLITRPFSTIYNLLKAPANIIVDMVNSLIRGLDSLSVKVPGWVPGIGGNTWGVNIPQLPHFASGGFMGQAGWAIVGEQGPEMVRLPASSYVYNNSQTSQMTAHNQTITLDINVNHQGSVVSHNTLTLDTTSEDKVMSQVIDAITTALTPALATTTRQF